MKCCLVHYLKGVRAYRRRIRELKEQVELWEDRAAAERAERAEMLASKESWQASARRWRGRVEDSHDLMLAMQATVAGLREEIERLQGRCKELEERDREERGDEGTTGTDGTTGTAAETEKGGVA